jgi:MFS family permease
MNLNTFLSIETWDKSERHFIHKSFLVYFLINGIILFSQTFRILYIYDNYGIIEGGIYLSLLLLVVFLFDYPTANLSDRIGQRGVIALALITHSIEIFNLASSDTLTSLYITAFIEGIAVAQFSGTLMAWFDNNYKKIANKYDKEYALFVDLKSKLDVSAYFGVFVFSVLGGYVALNYGRMTGLVLESILSLFCMVILLIIMTNLPNVTGQEIIEKNNALSNFKEGIKYLFSSKSTFLFLISSVFLLIEGSIFIQTMFIPLYYSYTGSEFLIGIADRIQVLISMVVKLFFMQAIMRKIKNLENYVYLFLLGLLCNIPVLITMYIFPFTNKLEVIPLVIIWVAFLLLDLFNLLGYSLLMRRLAMTTPSAIRNSIYSLVSSLLTLIVIFVLPIISYIYNTYSMFDAFAVLLIIHTFAMIMLFVDKRNIKGEKKLEEAINN